MRPLARWLGALAPLLLLAAAGAAAQKADPLEPRADLGLITGSIGKPEAPGDSQQYCVNIADQAAEARFAWQAKTIGDLEVEIDKRIADLESKRAEYQDWLKRRDEIQAKASDHVVGIYAKMSAESAALQLTVLDGDMASAVLSKLNARTASAILNQMEPGPAARLAKQMVDAVAKPPGEAGKTP